MRPKKQNFAVCTIASSASSKTAHGRSTAPEHPRQPLRCDRRRLRRYRRHRALSGQGLPLHVAGPAGRSDASRRASQRPLRHAALEVEHVSPLPRAVRRPIGQVTYVSGDTWNVNPIALKRIERLFCKNERAIVRMSLAPGGQPVTLVAVAAILVASIRLHCLADLRTTIIAGAMSSPATAKSVKARNSAGSSTARPSSSSRRTVLHFATISARVRHTHGGAALRLP